MTCAGLAPPLLAAVGRADDVCLANRRVTCSVAVIGCTRVHCLVACVASRLQAGRIIGRQG